MTSYDLENDLDAIRCHSSSGVPSQKAQAVLLNALEATFDQQAGTSRTPVTYFAALITTVEQSVRRNPSLGENAWAEGAILPAALHLLAVVIPAVPHPVLRTHLQTLLSHLVPLFPSVAKHTAPLCSQIAIFASLYPALEHTQLSTPQLRQSFVSILELSLDSRQKVRRRAQDALKDILIAPPPPLVKHPYLEQVAPYILNVLTAVEDRSVSKKVDGAVDTAVWCCGLLKSISEVWPQEHLAQLVALLLGLPKLGSPLLTTQSFNVVSFLLKAPTLSTSFPSTDVILKTLIDSPPPEGAHGVPEAWLEVIENAMVAYARQDPEGCEAALEIVWAVVWDWLKASHVTARIAAERALSAIVRYCISNRMIDEAVQLALIGDDEDEDAKRPLLTTMLVVLEHSFEALPFQQALPHILHVLSRFVSRLRYRTQIPSSFEKRPITAAELLLSDVVKFVGDLRTSPGFEYRERADDVLGIAIEVMGPAAFLEILPLNILPSDRETNQDEGRAFLLPLLARHITNTSLQHFVEYLVPLSGEIFELRTTAEAEDRPVEIKIWEACIEQIWACFKGYCQACADVPEAFTTEFAELLTTLLYDQPTLRGPIALGLRELLQTTKSLANSSMPREQMLGTFGVTPEDAAEGLRHLKGMAGDMLSVLFNVYSTMPSDSRGLIGEVVSLWLSIATPQDVLTTYNKVLDLLKQSLAQSSEPSLTNALTTLDLLHLMVPLLDPKTMNNLFKYTLSVEKDLLKSKDASVQKKAYRVLTSLVQTRRTFKSGDAKAIQTTLKRVEETRESALPGSKPDRMRFIREIMSTPNPATLPYIQVVLPEVILGLKELNEQTRMEAFECLVAMGHSIQRGDPESANRMDADDTPGVVPKNIEEYIKIAAAGMVGTSPQMISASTTAVARILFDFKDSISQEMQSEITSTIIVFLSSSNREIVKAALGFIKVAVAALPPATMRPALSKLVPALLSWSHDKKNPFKTTVLRIFGAMIKRYGFEAIWETSNKDDNAQVLLYVNKQQEKAKRRKARAKKAEDDAGDADDEPVPKISTGNAFEDVLYGSDSDEDEASDRDTTKPPAKTPTTARAPRLRLDDDMPLDLVHGTLANVTSAPAAKRRKPGQDAAHFKTDSETGRIIFEDEAKSSAATVDPVLAAVEGRAYLDQMVSVDGFTRTATGAVKFHRDTKKRRAMEMEADGDVEMGDAEAAKKSTANRPRVVKLGREFKAKKAGGDLKKAGQTTDPYAYLTLKEMAGKKKGPKVKYSITGRR